MRGEFIDVGGARLYYFAAGTRGSGEPIVLIHGFPTSSHLWSSLVPLLPEGHRIVVLDLLGFGRSDVPTRHDLSIRGHAERVVALLDALSISLAAVVGHDLGGGIAQALAINWPSRVSRLVLCDSVAFGHWPGWRTRLARSLMSLTRRLPPQWILAAIRRHLGRGYSVRQRGAHSVEHYLRPFVGEPGRDILMRHLAALDSGETAALGHRLNSVRAPTAVVWGQDDPFLSRRIAERLRATIPHASLDYIPNGRHFIPEEAPERLAQVVAKVIRR